MTLVYEITEKNNKQSVYDRIVKAITKYVRAGEAGIHLFQQEFQKIQTDFGVLTENNAPGPSDWITYITQNKLYSKEAIYEELFKSRPASQLYVKSTPNNPNSSRGFLFFTFKVNGNKMVIVDMAGNEDPYDIMIKTIPTYKLPFKEQKKAAKEGDEPTFNLEYSFLKSNDVSKNDMIVGIVKDNLTELLVNIFKQMYPAISYGLTATSYSIFIKYLYGQQNEGTTKFNQVERTIFALINKNCIEGKYDYNNELRYQKHYNMEEDKFLFNALKSNINFMEVIKILNYNIYDFVVSLYQNLIRIACDIKKYNGFFNETTTKTEDDNKKVKSVKEELNRELKKYEQPTNPLTPHMFDSVITTCDKIKAAIKDILNVNDYNTLLFSSLATNKKSVSIKINANDIYLSVLSIYYLCTKSIKGNISYDNLRVKDESKLFTDTDFNELNTKQTIDDSMKTLILEKIDKISHTIDVLYFDYYKNQNLDEKARNSIKDTIENLSYIKYVLQFIITSPLFVDNFKLNNSMLSKQENTVVSNIKLNNNLNNPFEIDKSSANGSTVGDILKTKINLNNAFNNQKIAIVKLEDDYETKPLHDKYSIIESSRDYFTTIIKEGFYINQVNYELVEFLKSRLTGTASGVYNKVDETVLTDLDTLLSNSYNPNKHLLSDTPPPACTNILNALNQLLTLTDPTKNNKFFMIANIRPDITKFRQGALNTLELVQDLKST
jgi:hypothetical protein